MRVCGGENRLEGGGEGENSLDKRSSIFPVWASGLRAPLPVGLLTGGITMHHGGEGGLCVHYLQDLSKLSFLLPNSIKEPLTRPRFVIMSL